MNSTKHYFVPGIEGLRAIAILMVILNHVGFSFAPGGFVGVDVFFVISGYLITQQLTREAHQTGRVDLLEFYARRVRRLFPALFTVVIATMIAGYFLLLPQDIPTTVKSAGAVLSIVSNHWFLAHTRGYFDTTADGLPLLHAWSLSVEEQFYLVWPFLILIFVYCERRFSRRLSTVALASVLFTSLAACIIQTRLNADKSFFLMPFRAWEFAVGGLVASTDAHRRLNSVAARWSINIGLLLLTLTAMFLDSTRDFPGWIAVIPCLASANIIIGLTHGQAHGAGRRLLESRTMRTIGTLSYSWYLWHWPILVFFRQERLGERKLVEDAMAAALALVLAYITYRWIENPLRVQRPWVLKTKRGTFGVAAIALLVAYGIGTVTLKEGRLLIKRTEARIGGAEQQSIHYSSCTLDPNTNGLHPLSDCLISHTNPESRIVLWGDSHAQQIIPALESLHEFSLEFGIRFFGACPSLLGVGLKSNSEIVNPLCAKFNQQVVDESSVSGNHITGIILASRWNYYLGMPVTEPGDFQPTSITVEDGATKSITDQSNVALVLADSLRSTFRALSDNGVRVLVIAPVPEFTFSVPGCLYRRQANSCVMPRSTVEKRRRLFVETARRVAADFDNVKIWDPIDTFCDQQSCKTAVEGKSLYRDSNHLSTFGAEYMLKHGTLYFAWLARR